VSAVLGIAWTAVTYLIIPVIVLEDRGIGESVARSAQLFRRTWGAQLAGGFGFGLLNLLLLLPGFGLALLLASTSAPLGIIVGVIYTLMMAAIISAVRQIFTVALYRYASRGDTPFGFTAQALGGPSANIRNATGQW